jgi:hypothetical protein
VDQGETRKIRKDENMTETPPGNMTDPPNDTDPGNMTDGTNDTDPGNMTDGTNAAPENMTD